MIDALAAYCADVNRCYFLPLDAFPRHSAIQLRLAPARNNQQVGVNWAAEFEFAATLGRYGAIAQLGERRAGSAKVAGSSPAGSTDGLTGGLAERGDFPALREPLQRTGLDLPDPLPRQPELPPDLLE